MKVFWSLYVCLGLKTWSSTSGDSLKEKYSREENVVKVARVYARLVKKKLKELSIVNENQNVAGI